MSLPDPRGLARYVVNSAGRIIGRVSDPRFQQGRVIRPGTIRIEDLDKQWGPFNQQGQVRLEQATGVLQSPDLLPTVVNTFYTQRVSYLTNRTVFEAADWVSNSLNLYVPSTHAFYDTYVDDDCPSILVYERVGVSTPFSYDPVIIDYSVEKSFRAAKLTGNADSTTTVIATWQAITAGSFQIQINGVVQEITGLNFSTDTTMALIASRINSAISGATCTFVTDHFEFLCTGSSGFTDISYAKPIVGATSDISGPEFLASNKGQATLLSGIRDGWMVELTKDTSVSAFPGLIQVM